MPPPAPSAVADRSRFYRPELDVLRLLAFLLIFVHHAVPDFWSHIPWLAPVGQAGGAGLQLFFLLSSYLITELLLREREKTGSIHLQAFFTRRILRIWPLYFFFIGFSLLISKTTHFTISTTPQFFAYLFLAGNWWTAMHSFLPTIVGPLWSISIEEQYYIVWPFIARFGSRLGLWAASLFFLAVATATLVYLGHYHAPRYAVWCNSLVEFQFFAVGAILALVLHGRDFILPAWTRTLFFVAAAATLVAAQMRFHIVSDTLQNTPDLLLGYAAFTVAVVLLFLAFLQARLPAAARPLIFLGKISYGLYVFHDLSIRLLFRIGEQLAPRVHGGLASALPAVLSLSALGVCICFAMLSYRFLELPFLHLKQKFTFVRSRAD